jgi:serine/threonine-protein kinase
MTMRSEDSPRLLSGRYQIGPVLGRGGMGEVRRARDQRLGRDVAIKLLRSDFAAHDVVRERFEHEARAAASLVHPNAVTVFDSGEDSGAPFIVMECLPGRTLADELRDGPLPAERASQMVSEVLGALSAAHRLGIVHRDVKPGNLLVSADGSFKVADFGIAKSVDALDYTMTGEILGTAAYLAPERLDGRAATVRSDLYSLGVVAYEALSGTKPFRGDTPVALARAMHTTDPVPLARVRPDADANLVAAVTRALAKNPADRFESADEMAAACGFGAAAPEPTRAPDARVPIDATESFAGATAVFPKSPLPTEVPPAVRSSNRAAVRLVVVGAVIAGIVLLAVVLSSRSSNSTGTDPKKVSTTSAPTTATPPTSALPGPLKSALDRLDQAVQP